MIFPHMYDFCSQEVTVYHQAEDGQVTTTVHDHAFLEFKKVESVNKLGSSESSSFLLVIPGDSQLVYPGDKVLIGAGEQVTTLEGWRNLVPSTVPGLCIVKWADVKRFGMQIVHTEAGG